MLIKGPGSPGLCEKLGEDSGIGVTTERFPDGEIYVRLNGNVAGEDCVLVQTTHPNDHLLELMFILDALRDNGARTVTAVVPYFGYSRQDKAFKEGEGVSSRAIARMISSYADRFFTIDIHGERILDFFDIPSTNLTALDLLMEYSMGFEPDLFLAPDEGAKERVNSCSRGFEVPWDHLEKTRIDGSTVEIKPKEMDVQGMTVVILDDIISTGGTMIEASKQLYDMGAEEVHAGCTHGLFTGGSWKRLEKHFDSVFCTDTIEGSRCEVSVAPLLEELL